MKFLFLTLSLYCAGISVTGAPLDPIPCAKLVAQPLDVCSDCVLLLALSVAFFTVSVALFDEPPENLLYQLLALAILSACVPTPPRSHLALKNSVLHQHY